MGPEQLPELPRVQRHQLMAIGSGGFCFYCAIAGFGQPCRVPLCSAQPGSKVDSQNQPWLKGSLEVSISCLELSVPCLELSVPCSALGISAVSAGPHSTGTTQPLPPSSKTNRLQIELLKTLSAQLLEFESFP